MKGILSLINSSDKKKFSIVVLASGRGSNLQAIIDAIQEGYLNSQIIQVISNKKDALALEKAKKAGLSFQLIESKGKNRDLYQQQLLEQVKVINPDLIVLAGYMRILPKEFIDSFDRKIINIHPSLLPSFKGLHAIEQALDAGVKFIGCTVHFVDSGIDTGPIILQAVEEVLANDDADSLSQRLLSKEHQILVKAIKLLEDNKVVLQGRKTLLR
ncbi:phosphoribosylglycinamide formyltransferase [bacterium K02(2017)]|nr:phosphoribosylglycinamide formyltransferase [bacterium K02(2017)]